MVYQHFRISTGELSPTQRLVGSYDGLAGEAWVEVIHKGCRGNLPKMTLM